MMQVSTQDRDALWAMVAYYGGRMQLRLNSSCSHLVVPSANGVSNIPILCTRNVRGQDCAMTLLRTNHAHSFFFYKNKIIVFPAQDKYSYFLPILG